MGLTPTSTPEPPVDAGPGGKSEIIYRAGLALSVFVPFAVLYMREPVRLDYLRAALCLIGAVGFVFRSSP